MDHITIERGANDELHEWQVIHLLELVIDHKQSYHGQNIEIVDDGNS